MMNLHQHLSTTFNSRTIALPTVFVLLFSSLFSACNSKNPDYQAQSALRDKVYVIHDTAMPKMAELNRLKRQLKKISDEKLAGKPDLKKRVEDTLDHLEKADSGMMTWMANFKEPAKLRKSISHEEIMQYLSTEEATITQVHEAINASMDEAKKILEEVK